MKRVFKLFSLMFVMSLTFIVSCQGPLSSVTSEAVLDVNGTRATAVTGSPVGWGKDVTGGGSGSSVTVDTYNELVSALDNDSASIIYVDGTINIESRITIQDRDNFSIIGINGGKLVSDNLTRDGSGIFYIKRVTNLIIQNLVFEGPGAYDTDGWDNLCLDDCQYVWVDHCDFQDGVDGNFDIKNKSNYISVTWTIFQYKKSPIAGGPGGADDHRYSNLIGSSDSATADDGKLKITYYYCQWGEGCRERMPRVRYGQVHILNCLFDSSVSNHCIRAAYKSNILVEGSYFDNQSEPIDLYKDYTSVVARNNSGCSDLSVGSSIFTPGYSYSVASASSIVSPIKSNAGATLDGSSSGGSDGGSSSGDAECNLTVSVSGDDVTLNWNISNFTPSKTLIYRDIDSDPSGRVKIGSATGTSYTDSNVADGTYYYWVKLYNAAGDIINSNADDATISTSSSGDPVCNLTVTVSGADVTLNWNYANFTPYKTLVYRDTDSDPSGRVNIGSASGLTFTDSNLSNGTYYYWVKLYQDDGEILNSNADDAIVSSSSGEAACYLAVTVSGSNAYLNWSYSNFDAEIQEVYRDTDSNPSGRTRVAYVSGNSYTDSGLADGTYYYWIKSRDADSTILNSNCDDAIIN